MRDVIKIAASPGASWPPDEAGFRIRLIQREVCDAMGITMAQMIGDARDVAIVDARHIAMFRAREELGCGYSQIARAFRRDHSTVRYALNRIKRRPTMLSIARSFNNRMRMNNTLNIGDNS